MGEVDPDAVATEVGRYAAEITEKGVSNNSKDREWSDMLDWAMGWEGDYKERSHLREFIHIRYHKFMGDKKSKAGNKEGAIAEWTRIGEIQENCQKARKASPITSHRKITSDKVDTKNETPAKL